MITEESLRPVAQEERVSGHVVVIRGLSIGIREQPGQAGLTARLQRLADHRPTHSVVDDLFLAGLYSRVMSAGHGYVVLTPTAITIPQTHWTTADAHARGEVEGSGRWPDVTIMQREPIEAALVAAGF